MISITSICPPGQNVPEMLKKNKYFPTDLFLT